MEMGELYREARLRITELVKATPEDALDAPVPACPAWTARDLLAHLSGSTADITQGNLDGVATDEWTGRQVAERRGRPVSELLAEWEEFAPTVESLLQGRLGGMAVTDCATHEQDIRGALGVPGGTESASFDFGLNGYVFVLDRRVRAEGLPALRLVAGEQEWVVGEGEPAVTVTAPPMELFRSLSGRRSEAQVRAYDWDGDPAPWLPIWSNFGPLPAADVHE